MLKIAAKGNRKSLSQRERIGDIRDIKGPLAVLHPPHRPYTQNTDSKMSFDKVSDPRLVPLGKHIIRVGDFSRLAGKLILRLNIIKNV